MFTCRFSRREGKKKTEREKERIGVDGQLTPAALVCVFVCVCACEGERERNAIRIYLVMTDGE